MEPENPALDDYVLGLASAKVPKHLPAAHRLRRRGGADPAVSRHVRLARAASRCTSRCSGSAAGRSRCARRCSSRTSSTSAAARCSGCSPSGARSGSTRSCASAGSRAWCWPGCRRARCAGSSGASRRSLGLARAVAAASASCRGRCPCTWTASPRGCRSAATAIADGTIPPGYAADDGVALLFRGHRARRGRVLTRRTGSALRIAADGEETLRSRACSRRRGPLRRRRPTSPSSAPCARYATSAPNRFEMYNISNRDGW